MKSKSWGYGVVRRKMKVLKVVREHVRVNGLGTNSEIDRQY